MDIWYGSFENEPTNAAWGERHFHIREQDGYQLSFVKPIENCRRFTNKVTYISLGGYANDARVVAVNQNTNIVYVGALVNGYTSIVAIARVYWQLFYLLVLSTYI